MLDGATIHPSVSFLNGLTGSMRLALALYASTAHANVPHYDLDLLYHDGRAHRLDKRLLIWVPPSPRRLRTRV